MNDAIATSTCRWVGRPNHGVYVALFKQLISVLGILKSVKPTFYPLGSTLNSLLGLLRAIESRIRNPATPVDEREVEREWRSSCAKEWTDFLSGSVATEVYYYGPLWCAYYQFLGSHLHVADEGDRVLLGSIASKLQIPFRHISSG